MKPQRYMNSRFDSHCSNCGHGIARGDRILYQGRGRALCMNCAPPEFGSDNAATDANAAPPPGGDWSSMLSWNDTTPKPGDSIGQPTGPQPVAKTVPSAAADQKSRVSDSKPAGAIDSIANSNTKAGPRKCDQRENGFSDQQKQAVTKAENSGADPALIRVISDHLVLIVNAVSAASRAERAALEQFAADQERITASGERAQVWRGLAGALRG